MTLWQLIQAYLSRVAEWSNSSGQNISMENEGVNSKNFDNLTMLSFNVIFN